MKSKASSAAASRAEMKYAPFRDRKNVGGLSLPEVVQNLLREGSLRWDANDCAYIVVDGEVFETRSVSSFPKRSMISEIECIILLQI
jgi:hypothetical protein